MNMTFYFEIPVYELFVSKLDGFFVCFFFSLQT